MVLDLGFYVRITQKVKLLGVSIIPDQSAAAKDFLSKVLEGKDLMCKIVFSNNFLLLQANNVLYDVRGVPSNPDVVLCPGQAEGLASAGLSSLPGGPEGSADDATGRRYVTIA